MNFELLFDNGGGITLIAGYARGLAVRLLSFSRRMARRRKP